MKVKELQYVLIEMIRSELAEGEVSNELKEKLTTEVLSALYNIAKQHDLAHIVSSSLYRNGVQADHEILAKFQKKEMMSVYRYEQMRYTYQEICTFFNETEIPFIPLKGSVIRPYYPNESMRTSCDIDILVHEEDLDFAVEVLKNKGYQIKGKDYHDISLFSPNTIHLELHFNIYENTDDLDVILKDAWQYARQKERSMYAFTEEFFVFYMFAHMSYHFLAGGCGIKALMDVWIMEHKMGVSYICAAELLEKAGIYTFAKEISNLAEVCFSGKEGDEFSETLLSYILSGGVYGTAGNRIAVKKTKNKSMFAYVWKRLFLPYKSMTILYPVLKKAPILLPFCWIARFFKMLFGKKGGKAIEEVKTANGVTDDQVEEVQKMCSRLGL